MNKVEDNIGLMRCEIGGFVNDLIEATKLRTVLKKKYNKLIFCGMGASVVGGEIIASTMYYVSEIPVTVAKTAAMPCWADSDTLVVVCSYSGNTMETIDMYESAVAKGMDVIAVTHGGKLEELSIKNGNYLVKIGGTKIQPRSAIGWFIGILAGIVEDAGGPNLREELTKNMDDFERFRQNLESEDNISKRIAMRIKGKVPVIYSVPDLSAIATRWKNQLNENSKVIAFSGVMPEFNHNEVVGWCEDELRSYFEPIIIKDGMSEVVTNTMTGTLMALKDVGIEPLIVNIAGKTALEREINALLIGDYASLYLASLLGKDPMEVETITKIKARIGGSD